MRKLDGASVSDVVRRVRVLRAQDSLADEQGLHAHLIGIRDESIQFLSIGHLGKWTAGLLPNFQGTQGPLKTLQKLLA